MFKKIEMKQSNDIIDIETIYNKDFYYSNIAVIKDKKIKENDLSFFCLHLIDGITSLHKEKIRLDKVDIKFLDMKNNKEIDTKYKIFFGYIEIIPIEHTDKIEKKYPLRYKIIQSPFLNFFLFKFNGNEWIHIDQKAMYKVPEVVLKDKKNDLFFVYDNKKLIDLSNYENEVKFGARWWIAKDNNEIPNNVIFGVE